jgi:hypothetical protein
VTTKLEQNVDRGCRMLVFILQFAANIKVLYMFTKIDKNNGTDDLAQTVNVQRKNIFFYHFIYFRLRYFFSQALNKRETLIEFQARNLVFPLLYLTFKKFAPIPVAGRSKAWVCGFEYCRGFGECLSIVSVVFCQA